MKIVNKTPSKIAFVKLHWDVTSLSISKEIEEIMEKNGFNVHSLNSNGIFCSSTLDVIESFYNSKVEKNSFVNPPSYENLPHSFMNDDGVFIRYVAYISDDSTT